jgi:7,8-dihydropterin-6-yl-methyl-4-(beta-D-ribofuranosyl)aminobenzene 5'-phosphate synthase
MPEVSLVLDTPKGPIVIVGCSHPGVENILANLVAQTHQPNVYELIGGVHLAGATLARIDHTISELLDTYHVQRTALGHCSGERTFALVQKRFGDDYLYAGVGEVLPL